MPSELDESVFANVDLDIYSSDDLRPLVDGFGDKVIELWVGKVRRTYEAHLEIGWSRKQTPTSIILRFCWPTIQQEHLTATPAWRSWISSSVSYP